MNCIHLFRGLAAAVAASVATAAMPATQDADPPSVVPAAAFFNLDDMNQPLISPGGDSVAVLVRNKAGRRQLAIIDTADLHNARVVASFDEFDIAGVHWVDNDRLVFSLWDESVSADEERGTGLYAIDRNGENLRTLILYRGKTFETGTMVKQRILSPWEYGFLRTLDDGSGDVVVRRYVMTTPLGQKYRQTTGTTPLRLNTRTGVTRDAIGGTLPDHVFRWVFDGQGRVRVAVAVDAGVTAVLTPEQAGGWKERAHFPSYGVSPDAYDVQRAAVDGRLYVSRAAHDEYGSHSLYRLDIETGQPEAEPVVHAAGFDVDAEFVEDLRQKKVLGVHYASDAGGTVWFDPAMKEVQAKVDARLPGLVNRIDPASCGCAKRVLVASHSDRQPPVFFLYDRSDDTLIPIGSARPAIKPRQMADTDFVRIRARDGHDLPIYVTKPHGKGPWPTVVLVHGGPYLRVWDWEWDAESQFLASRGYLVVKPEFRGSEGFGSKLFLSGLRQWGLAMQDDIADATTWAAKQGLADAGRTCIAGASYGGYATLMGLVRYPELYRCGVAWAAVTDIDLMYDVGWSDASDAYRAYGMPVLIGDQVKDAAQLAATSPLKQAGKINRPLLLAHGGVDVRVPIIHAVKMRDALEAHHAPVTWIEYKDEAHGWYKPETRVDFYERMEAFLAANIGPAATAAVAHAPAASAAHPAN